MTMTRSKDQIQDETHEGRIGREENLVLKAIRVQAEMMTSNETLSKPDLTTTASDKTFSKRRNEITLQPEKSPYNAHNSLLPTTC